MNIQDFSDFPSKDLNHKVTYNLNGFLKIFVNNAFIVPFVSLILSDNTNTIFVFYSYNIYNLFIVGYYWGYIFI